MSVARRSGLAAASVVLLVACAGGCGSAKPSLDERRLAYAKEFAAQFRQENLPEAAAAIDDGKVTKEEYNHLFDLMTECVEGLGGKVEVLNQNPANPDVREVQLLPAPPGGKKQIEEVGNCQGRFMGVETVMWNEPAPMSPALAAEVRDCLRGKGNDVPDPADDMVEFVQAIGGKNAQQLDGCISDGVAKVDPEIQGMGYAIPDVY